MNTSGEQSQYMRGRTTSVTRKENKVRKRIKVDVPLTKMLATAINRDAVRHRTSRAPLIRAILTAHYFSKDVEEEVCDLTAKQECAQRGEMIDRLMYELSQLASTISAVPAPDLSLSTIVVYEAVLQSHHRIEESLIEMMRLIAMRKSDEQHLGSEPIGGNTEKGDVE